MHYKLKDTDKVIGFYINPGLWADNLMDLVKSNTDHLNGYKRKDYAPHNTYCTYDVVVKISIIHSRLLRLM